MTDPEQVKADLLARIDAMDAEYHALAERNWNRIQQVHAGYKRFNLIAKWLLAMLVVIQIGFGIVAVVLVAANEQRIRDIQASRVSICQDTNMRHDRTVALLAAEIAQI